MRCTIKFQLKKVLCLGVAVGNCAMNERELFMNIQARAGRGSLCFHHTPLRKK